jgi:hypothetical protein
MPWTVGEGRLRWACRACAWALLASLVACGPPDSSAPTLTLAGWVDGRVVVDPHVTLTVSATDDRGVVAVSFATDRGASGPCPPTGAESYACGPVPLDLGDTTVTITAADRAGNWGSVSVVLRYEPASDTRPPDVSLSGASDGEVVTRETITLTVMATDDVGVASVRFATDHGAAGTCGPPAGDAYPCGPIPLPLGDTTVTVEAEDAAGNVARASLRVRREAAEPPPPDTTPPTLTVEGIEDGEVVTTPEITVTARVTDDVAVAQVRFATDHGAVGSCGPPHLDAYPCGPIPLPLGDTLITVTARDAAGNTASVEFAVTREPLPAGPSAFDVELVFFDHAFLPGQMAAFEAAADRWASVIVGDLADVTVDLAAGQACGRGEPGFSGTIDDVLVFVTSFEDGVGGVLAMAGPCRIRAPGEDAGTSLIGFMSFDALDLPGLEASGQLVDVVVHEMGHVLGFGTLWEFAPYHDLLDYLPNDGSTDCRNATGYFIPPQYTGAAGVAAWHDLGGTDAVPVEDEGGPGTRCGHWDEETFGHELMTGYLNTGVANPLSRLSVRSLQDLGYTVDAEAADPYALPSGVGPSALGTLDIGAAEVLLAPRGAIDVDTGEVRPLPADDR